MISVTILVRDGARCIKQVLESLRSFDEVLLYDTGSCDETLDIAKLFSNVSIHQGKFEGFGICHNKAAALAKHDWIFSIDSDEIVTPALAKEIHALRLDPTCVYSIPFLNYYQGKKILWCGWYPETHVRLYNKKTTSFSTSLVHEKVIDAGKCTAALQNPIEHHSYANLAHFLEKMQRYSTLFAEQNKGKRNSSPTKALLHGMGAFCKSYFLKRGFLGGYEGFLISFYNAHTAFYKYLKLYEANRSCSSV